MGLRLSDSKRHLKNLSWISAFLTLLFLLIFFQKPFFAFQKSRQEFSFLESMSSKMHFGWEDHRSPAALLNHFNTLSKKKEHCVSGIRLLPYAGEISPSISGEIKAVVGTDFRKHFFELRTYSPHFNCKLQDNAKELFKTLYPYLQEEPFLLEATLRLNEKNVEPIFATFGLINGTSALFIDGKMLTYFPEIIESGQHIPLQLTPGAHRLSLLIYPKGYSVPGVATARFVGIIGTNPSAFDLLPNPYLRQSRSMITVLGSIALSLFLLIFALFQQKSTSAYWPLPLSTLLLSFAIQQALQLDHIQSNLDGVRYFRAFAIFLFFDSLLNILNGTLIRIKKTLSQISSSYLTKNEEIAYRVFLDGSKILLFGAWITSVYLLISKLDFVPRLREAQYDVLIPTTALTLTLALVLILGAFSLELRVRKVARDEVAKTLGEVKRVALTSGLLFIVYLLSYQELLSSWLKLRQASTLKLLLGSQGAPFLVGFVALVMLARMLRDQALYERILPPSVLEVIPDARNRDLDRTESEQGWVLLNDLVGSTKLKLSNLAIVTHLLQSVLHKIHKTYFEDSIHFVTSLGDALILTLRSPKVLKREDPILEKFSRVYSLHRDGARELTDAHFTLLSLLRLQSHELALALNSIPQNTSEHLSFRTILCSSYYFYGLNSELSSLDSKILYLISKSEKLLTDSHQGGFIIFGSLWNTLSSAMPEIAPHFEKKLLDRENAPESIRQDLPECVMRLIPGEEERFEKALEKTLGEPIPSRIRREIRESVSKTAQSISKAESLELLVKIPIPELQNFSEKNLILRAISERASELEAWHTPKLHEKILARTFSIGVPAMGLLKAVSERDHRYEPARLIADLHSKSAKTRNLAMRFLRLARVKGPFRPSAPDPSDFCSKAIGAWLKNPSLFSVESHFAMYEWLASDPIRQEMLHQSLQTAEAKDLHQYLNTHPAPSLQALSLMLNHHSIPSAKKAA